MKSWLDLEERFRRIADPLQYLRIDFQWGAAGEYWRLCGMPYSSLYSQFDALAELASLSLEECVTVYPELISIINAETVKKNRWYRALKVLSSEFKFENYGCQIDENGNEAGHIYLGRILNIGNASANLCLLLHSRYPIPEKREMTINNINISNSAIGVLNTGQIESIESICMNIESLNNSGAQDLSEAIKKLTKAVSECSNLDASKRSEALEQLEELSAQATLQPELRTKTGVLKGIFSCLEGTLAAAGDVAEVWSTWGPVIQRYFGF